MRISQVTAVIIVISTMILSLFVTCGVPADPFDKSKTKVSLLLKSSNGQENQLSITDTVGNTVNVVVSIDLSQHFDSTVTIIDRDGVQEYYFKYVEKTDVYATETYPVTFSVKGNHQVTVTGYVEGLPNREARALIAIEARKGLSTNLPPKLVISGRRVVVPGNTLALSVKATDPDAGQTAIVSQVKLPAGATFSNDTLRWVPTIDNLGSDTAIFAATDNGTPVLTTRDTVVITVSATAVNQPPAWSVTTLQRTARLGTKSTLELQDLCTDPDGDTIAFTLLPGAPEGDTVIGATWSYTPASSVAVSHLVKIVAADPSGETDTMVIDLTVSADAADVTPPVKKRISPAQDSQVVATPSFLVKASFSDESGVDTVLCSMGAQSFAITSTADTLYSATVTGLVPGLNTIRFIATDAAAAANTCTLYVVLKYDAVTTHNVTFDKNDAAATGTMAQQDISEGTAVPLSANAFVKAGSSFTGWATSATGAVAYADAASYTMGTTDVTLYAKWSANTHKVTFDKNDVAATGTMVVQNIADGTAAPLSANAFVKAGSSFTGWATSATGAVAYADASSYTMGTADVTLYAKWAANTHKVTFDKNDAAATGSMTVQNIAEGADAPLTSNAFVKAGSSFTGWATSAAGAVVYADAASYTMGTADVTLYAKWAANTHKVTFDKNDAAATGTMVVQNIAEGTAAPLSANAFVKAGSSFTGWATSAAGAVVYADAASYTMGTADVTLYAIWAANTHKVTFNKNDAAATGTMAVQNIVEGTAAPLSANAFVKAGSSFTGWATSAAGAVVYADAVSYTMGTADVTLYAKWAVNTHIVTFNKNDAAATGTMANQTIAEGISAPLTTNAFTKAGSSFAGWATSATGAVTYTDEDNYTMGTADATLYAKWTVITHTVTFNKNDAGASGSMANQSIAQGMSAPLTANGFTKPGSSFAGWATSASGAVVYTNQASFPMGTADVTLFAKWTVITHTVTFNKNDAAASGTMANQSIAEGTSANLTAIGFTKAGWSFAGWATTSAGSAVYSNQDSYPMGSADVTLYAKWNPISFSITFNKNDVDATGSMTPQAIPSGSSTPLKTVGFSKVGWTFAGWATTSSGTKAFDNMASYTMGTNDVTLYAKWTPINYKITFLKNNWNASGTMNQQTIACGSSAALTSNTFTDNCRTFIGWSTSSTATSPDYVNRASFTMGPSDVTLYAVWEITPLSLSHKDGQPNVNVCIDDVINVGTTCGDSYEWYADFWGTGDFSLISASSVDLVGQGTPTLKSNTPAGSYIYCIVTDLAGRKVKSGTWFWGLMYCQ